MVATGASVTAGAVVVTGGSGAAGAVVPFEAGAVEGDCSLASVAAAVPFAGKGTAVVESAVGAVGSLAFEADSVASVTVEDWAPFEAAVDDAGSSASVVGAVPFAAAGWAPSDRFADGKDSPLGGRSLLPAGVDSAAEAVPFEADDWVPFGAGPFEADDDDRVPFGACCCSLEADDVWVPLLEVCCCLAEADADWVSPSGAAGWVSFADETTGLFASVVEDGSVVSCGVDASDAALGAIVVVTSDE